MGEKQKYDVVLLRELVPGMDRGKVEQNLATAFGLEISVISELLSRAPTRVKRDTDAATANQYAEALRQAGAQSEIRLAGGGTGGESGAGAGPALEEVLRNMGVPAWAVEPAPPVDRGLVPASEPDGTKSSGS